MKGRTTDYIKALTRESSPRFVQMFLQSIEFSDKIILLFRKCCRSLCAGFVWCDLIGYYSHCTRPYWGNVLSIHSKYISSRGQTKSVVNLSYINDTRFTWSFNQGQFVQNSSCLELDSKLYSVKSGENFIPRVLSEDKHKWNSLEMHYKWRYRQGYFDILEYFILILFDYWLNFLIWFAKLNQQ